MPTIAPTAPRPARLAGTILTTRLLGNIRRALRPARERGLRLFSNVEVVCGDQVLKVEMAMVMRVDRDAQNRLVDPMGVVVIGTPADTKARAVLARAGTRLREVWRVEAARDRVHTQTRVPGGWLKLKHMQGDGVPGRLTGTVLPVATVYAGAGG